MWSTTSPNRSPDSRSSLSHDYSKYDIVKATQYGVIDRCQELIEAGYDVRQPDAENVTLLHWAAINNRKELVKYYMSKGAYIDQLGGDLMSTPLHWATRQGHLQMVVLLMQHGADPSLRDGEGCSAIHLASQFAHTSIVAYLIAKGQDVNMPDRNGMTPLMWACYRVVNPDPTRLLLTFSADIHVRDRVHRNTALHWAVISGNHAVVTLLLDAGANLEARNDKEDTPSDLATSKNNRWMVNKLKNAREERGLDHTNMLQRFVKDKVVRWSIMWLSPLLVILVIGAIFQIDSKWWEKLIMFAALLVIFYFVRKFFFDDRVMDIAPLAVFGGTILLKYVTFFCWMWPISRTVIQPLLVIVFSIALWYYFLKCWKMDPGIVKATTERKYRTVIELAEQDSFDLSWFCTTCIVKKPVRSKHCTSCNKCIAKFDHHCPWVGNCVGALNHKFFIGYLLSMLILLVTYQYCTIYYWKIVCIPYLPPVGKSLQFLYVLQCQPWTVWMFVNAVVHTLWVTALLLCQMYQICFLGMTTNERINCHRYSHFSSGPAGDVSSPFHRGVIGNFVDFFELSCFGFCPLHHVDWLSTYNDDVKSSQSYSYQPLLSRENFQYV